MSELTLNASNVSFSDFAFDQDTVKTALLEIIDDVSKQVILKQTQIAVTTRTKHTGEVADLEKHKSMLVQALGSFQNDVRESVRTLNSVKWVYSQLVSEEEYNKNISGPLPKAPEAHLQPQPQILAPQNDGVVGVPGALNENNSRAGLVSP